MTAVAPPHPGRRIFAPPGFPLRRYVAMLNHSAVKGRPLTVGCARFRRAACEKSPLLFALIYLSHHLRLNNGGPITLSVFHVAMAEAAKRWMRKDIGPKEVRDAWVAPRKGAKTTWLFLILPLWAMAYGHRKFIVVYSDTVDQAAGHLLTLKLELAQNELLRYDFPELCEPMRVGGRPLLNTRTARLAANDCLIMIKGMNSAVLGPKFRERRPDALLFDEIEPKEGNYSIAQKATRLTDLIEAIFPCNDCAVVQIAGTTVMHGSIIHDLIEGREWVGAQNIAVHHFRPIIVDPLTGKETSIWPQRWPLEHLYAEQKSDPRGYAKNYENEPVIPDGTFWDEDDIIVDDSLLKWTTERILVLDPAAKSKKTNDETGIAMLAYAGNVRRTSVERCMGVRMKPLPLRELVHNIIRKNGIRTVLVDTTNGGDWVINGLSPLPDGAKFVEPKIRRSKDDRFTDLHYDYQRKRVVHARRLPSLEAQMKAYPKAMHDDRIDAVCIGVEYFFERAS
jgi:hypothetical protein